MAAPVRGNLARTAAAPVASGSRSLLAGTEVAVEEEAVVGRPGNAVSQCHSGGWPIKVVVMAFAEEGRGGGRSPTCARCDGCPQGGGGLGDVR